MSLSIYNINFNKNHTDDLNETEGIFFLYNANKYFIFLFEMSKKKFIYFFDKEKKKRMQILINGKMFLQFFFKLKVNFLMKMKINSFSYYFFFLQIH